MMEQNDSTKDGEKLNPKMCVPFSTNFIEV
jgi:hypothetical protein